MKKVSFLLSAVAGMLIVVYSSAGLAAPISKAASASCPAPAPLNALPSTGLNGVVFHDGITLVVGDFGRILISRDQGVSWQTLPCSQDDLTSVTWSGSQFFAVGLQGAILSSPDGMVWKQQIPPIAGVWKGVSSDGAGRTVVVGHDDILIHSGSIWQKAPSGHGGKMLNNVAWVGNRFIAVGEDGQILSSNKDATRWQETIPARRDAKTLKDLVAGKGQVISVGYTGTILKSGLDDKWSAQKSGANHYFSAVDYSPSLDRFVAVGARGLIVSGDGHGSWSGRQSGVAVVLKDIAWAGKRFLAVGKFGVMLSSPDGINWTLLNGVKPD